MMQERRTSPQFHQRSAHDQAQRIFTASEVAEYEYCPRVWWYQQYEPLVGTDTDELFARMVEMEHIHGSQATALPEYQVIEQLLVRRGAFAQGQEQHQAHADAVAEISGMSDVEDELAPGSSLVTTAAWSITRRVMLALALTAMVMIVGAILLGAH